MAAFGVDKMRASKTSREIITTSAGPRPGTIIFTAMRKRKPLQGVEILIDGENGGRTDAEGVLIAEWLLAGKHSWDATYHRKRIASGDFTVPEVTELEFIDFKSDKPVYSRGESITGTLVIKNTGTTVIDHLNIKGSVKCLRYSAKRTRLKHKRNLSIAPGQLWTYVKTKRMPMEAPRGRYRLKNEVLIDDRSFGSRKVYVEVK